MAGGRHGLIALSLVRTHQAEGVDVGALGDALDLFSLERVSAGSVLYEQGDAAGELQLLVEGTVSVRVAPDDRQVALIQAPAIIGHLGVLTGLPRSATVSAVDTLYLGRLSDQELWRLVEGGSKAAVALRRLFLASLVGLLETTNAQVASEVAEHGQPVEPPATPPARPATPPGQSARSRPRSQDLGASDSWGFDEDLLDQVEDIKLVQSEADKNRGYKG